MGYLIHVRGERGETPSLTARGIGHYRDICIEKCKEGVTEMRLPYTPVTFVSNSKEQLRGCIFLEKNMSGSSVLAKSPAAT